jgi:hypothetical protein
VEALQVKTRIFTDDLGYQSGIVHTVALDGRLLVDGVGSDRNVRRTCGFTDRCSSTADVEVLPVALLGQAAIP